MNISLTAGRAALKLKKHAPNLLFGAGVVGMTGTVVLACRATLKAQAAYSEHKASIQGADKLHEIGQYDKEKHKQVIIATWVHTSKQYAKLYGPAFILGVTSIAMLTKSHTMLTSRNSALMAAYAGVDSAFKAYRERVVKELGLDKDTEFAHGSEEDLITDYDKKGNGVVKSVTKAPLDAKTAYGRWFDETNRHWDKDQGYNTSFLMNQQKWANLLLKQRGHLFLNEVYDMLGMERSPAGQEVGWYYDNDEGDGYVDFGFNRYPEFMNGLQRSVFLDFNVDGPILNFI